MELGRFLREVKSREANKNTNITQILHCLTSCKAQNTRIKKRKKEKKEETTKSQERTRARKKKPKKISNKI